MAGKSGKGKSDAGEEKRELIVVQGVVINSRLPSPALLERRFEEIYRQVDVGKKVIRLVRGYFLNRLSSLARKYYCEILPRYAVRIADGLYIVPMGKLVDLEREISELKRLYADYEEKLKAFFYRGEIPTDVKRNAKFYEEYKDIVLDYIKRLSNGKVEIELPNIVERVRINLYPLKIDPELWRSYVSDELREKESRLLKQLEEDIERARREAVQTAQADIKKRLLELNQAAIKALNQLKKRKRVNPATRNKIVRMLDELKKSNLFSDPEIDGLIRAYEGLSRAIEEASEKTSREEKVKVIEEIGRIASVTRAEEKPEEEKREEKLADYVEVFRDFADAIGSRLKAEEPVIGELKEVDKEFVEALGKLSEAIAS